MPSVQVLTSLELVLSEKDPGEQHGFGARQERRLVDTNEEVKGGSSISRDLFTYGPVNKKNVGHNNATLLVKTFLTIAEQEPVIYVPVPLADPVGTTSSHVEDKWYSRFTAAANAYESEMGLLCISVVAYTGNAGQLVIDIHDEIASILKVPGRSFEEIYPDKSKDIKRTLLEYLKILAAPIAGGSAGVHAGVTTGVNAGPGPDTLTIQLDPNRFPIAPRFASWNKVSKEDLERLYRMYITQHYRLACSDRHRQAPFQRIAARPSDFIDAEYLPNGITISDPRSMKLEAVVKLFQNITIREEAHGIPNAFRFKAILSSRKQGTLCEARYDGGVAESEPRPASGPVPGRRAEPQSSIVTSGSSPTLIQQQLLLAPYSFNTIHRPIIQSTADLPPAPAPVIGPI
ncbi:hypothetical protein BYT27DRAFT_7254409 [Phlegmacium glaucopus]|nr:hypothetical protein BYT27DRAFT_7254409 [Phlegmacium glaucopus]